MAEHRLFPTPATVHWGFFDGTLAPALTIDPGDTVVVRSVSGGPDEAPRAGAGFTVDASLMAIHADVAPDLGPHILVGPIAVRGAMPGDALRVTILDVALADDWGFNLIRPLLGALPDLFPYARLIHLPIDRARGLVRTPWGIDIPARPFFGVMGTAPALAEGRLTSVVPGSFGGNIDNKELGAGSVLTLPVAVPGGLLSVGDGHAAQGDGEVCLTAVETGLTGTLRIDLVVGAAPEAPFAETPTHLIAMAFDADLDIAAGLALRRMIGLIEARTTLGAEDAYRLCSLAGDLRVTQVVNGRKGIHVMVPLDLLAQAAPSSGAKRGS
jgi:acetamidase/formamidase